jgi:hypothetical protein
VCVCVSVRVLYVHDGPGLGRRRGAGDAQGLPV